MAVYRRCPLLHPSVVFPANHCHGFIMEIEMHAVALSGNCSHPSLKELIFKGVLKDSTPLILACHYGDLNAVERIIEHWKANVNEAAVYFDDPIAGICSIKIDSATPLFVASSNGHTKLVRYLIEKGADVSAKTHSIERTCYDGLTPLYGVVCNLRYYDNNLLYHKRRMEESAGIVRLLLESGADASSPSSRPSDGFPIWTKELCRADVITELINHGMDLKQCDPFANGTVLHYWAGDVEEQEESLTIIKLLIEKGANLLALDSWGFTPLLKAANGRKDESPNVKVLDFLLERSDYSWTEKIEAMELAGAVILGNEKNAPQFHKAFDYWRRAFQLRQIDIEDSGLIQKAKLNLKNVRTNEWITSVELEDVIEHSETFMTQSFLVRLRIFSNKSWEAIESLFEFYTRDNSIQQLKIQRRFVELFDIIWAMLETLRLFDSREEDAVRRMTVRIIEKLIVVLAYIKKDYPGFLDAYIIKTSLELITARSEFSRFTLNSLLQLVTMLSSVPPMLLNADIMEILTLLIRRDWWETPGVNILHRVLMCSCENMNIYAIVRLLLRAGSNPNAINIYGNTPLYLLVLYQKLSKSMNITARLLLGYGAKLNMKNVNGKTAVDLWKQKNIRRKRQLMVKDDFIGGDDLPDWGLECPTLTWLTARVIRCNRIPHLELPATLISMIKM